MTTKNTTSPADKLHTLLTAPLFTEPDSNALINDVGESPDQPESYTGDLPNELATIFSDERLSALSRPRGRHERGRHEAS